MTGRVPILGLEHSAALWNRGGRWDHWHGAETADLTATSSAVSGQCQRYQRPPLARRQA